MNKLEKILSTIGLISATTPIENEMYAIGARVISVAAVLILLAKQRYNMHAYNPFKNITKNNIQT